MKFSVEVDMYSKCKCIQTIIADNELLLTISSDILSKIEKKPGNKWYAGWFKHRYTEFDPLPELDLVDFMKYVSLARNECIEDNKPITNNTNKYIQQLEKLFILEEVIFLQYKERMNPFEAEAKARDMLRKIRQDHI